MERGRSSQNVLRAINLWRRFFRTQLEAVGLGWATFQVLRKTNAPLSRKAGVDGNWLPEGASVRLME
jgi:hypothetical protein